MPANPFLNAQGVGAVDSQSRLDCVRRFTLSQCRAAMVMPDLQITVVRALQVRIRKLKKEQGHD